jgi:hypothetical protein
MENTYNSQQPNVIMVGKQKSSGTAILLTVLFGPLGLLYVSIPGGLVLTLITLVLSWTIIVPIVCWIASIIWAAMGANSANQKALTQVNQMMQQQAPPVYQQHTHVNFVPPQTPPITVETPMPRPEKIINQDDLV